MSKGDEIMPAIKTLKLLAHGDSYGINSGSNNNPQSNSLIRTSSLNDPKSSNEKPLTNSKSLRKFSSKSNENLLNNDSEQPQTGTDDGDS